MPCAAEGNRGHRTFRHKGSVFIQGPNSYVHPTIHRRKRVVRDPLSHCSDTRAPQPTAGRRRYFTDARKAMRQRVWQCSTSDGVVSLPVVVDEGPLRLGREIVGTWGVV